MRMTSLLGVGGSATAAPMAAGGDPFWDDVVLLIDTDGTNGATSFTDLSSKSKTINTIGDAQLSNAIAGPFGEATALALDGAGDWLEVPSDVDISFSDGRDFVVEGWAYSTDLSHPNDIFNKRGPSNTAEYTMRIRNNTGDSFSFITWRGFSTNTLIESGTGVASTGTWYYMSMQRSGSDFRAWVGQTPGGTASLVGTDTFSNDPESNSNALNIGRSDFNSSRIMEGAIAHPRITRAARYPTDGSDITVPTEKWPQG